MGRTRQEIVGFRIAGHKVNWAVMRVTGRMQCVVVGSGPSNEAQCWMDAMDSWMVLRQTRWGWGHRFELNWAVVRMDGRGGW